MRHEESTLQIRCVRWWRLAHRGDGVLFSIPNGGRRSAVTGAILKAEGALAGVADLFLMRAVGGAHGLWIEMKTEKGRQSEAQRVFQKEAEEAGYAYEVCRSFEGFVSTVEGYLSQG